MTASMGVAADADGTARRGGEGEDERDAEAHDDRQAADDGKFPPVGPPREYASIGDERGTVDSQDDHVEAP